MEGCAAISPAGKSVPPSVALETVMIGRKQLLPPLPSESQIIVIKRRGHRSLLSGQDDSVYDSQATPSDLLGGERNANVKKGRGKRFGNEVGVGVGWGSRGNVCQ